MVDSAFEAHWKGEKAISGCLVSRVQIKEIITLKCHLLLFLRNNNEPSLEQILMYDAKWILYDNRQ